MMRLRVIVRRNGIPDFPLVWAVDTTSSPTVYQLLEQINEVAPVTDDDQWGLEDYAVEIKGTNGVNYECLHYQLVQSVMKDEDEIIIRPLLHQDLRAREVSGRHQISTDGRRIYDGLPLGRPKLKRIRNRPAIKIQPLKRQRLLDNEDREDEEEPKALENTPSSEPNTENNQQLVLHADFDDDDSEDDDDFAPEDDDDSDGESEEKFMGNDDSSMDAEENEDSNIHADEYEEDAQQPQGDVQEAETIEPTLSNVADPAFRAMIRELHSAFPASPMEVCKHILQGTKGNMGEAYEALNRGFVPSKPKSAIAEVSDDQDDLSATNTRFELTSQAKQPENQDSMQVEADMTADSLLEYYDHNGLPPGSIKSGKALKFMADAMRSSPVAVPSPSVGLKQSKTRTSVASIKSKTFPENNELNSSLKSTPAIDMHSQDVEDSSEDSSDSSSSSDDGEEDANEDDDKSSDSDSDKSSNDPSSSSGSSDDDESHESVDLIPKEIDVSMKDNSSSDESNSDSESSSASSDNGEVAQGIDADMDEASSSSDSDGESSNDPSSDDEAPEENSSRLNTSATITKTAIVTPSIHKSALKKQGETRRAAPGKGKIATRSRNQRRRCGYILQRYKNRGILPDETTTKEFEKLRLLIDERTSPEEALAKLNEIRNSTSSSNTDDFERKRKELLDSLASGGIELGPEGAMVKATSPPYSNNSPADVQTWLEVPDSQSLPTTTAMAPEPTEKAVGSENMETETPKPSTVTKPPRNDTPLSSPNPPPASTEPSQKDATRPRRSRPDLGAGKRLIFGALGMKAPRTKADEDKVKSDLMKFARPLKTAKPTEEESTIEPPPEEDSEAWREKINYRAVECVQEGIELSEPPFPFVQRWDPQQQSSWSKGNQGGKRKQAQRDQEQYYNDTRASKKQKQRKAKHAYAEEQEYLEASYEPSYQEDTMELQYDDSSHLEKLPTNDINDEVSQQLINDISNRNSAVSQGPEDLVSLPEDPSSLPDLEDGQAKISMTIAFKSLECSAATNWSPMISAYRTAIVITLSEDGLLHLSLAMRDRQISQKRYDSNTHERIYDKFEVPDDEEMDEEDNGTLYISFRDMIQPKIVQQPPIDPIPEGETQRNDAMEVDSHANVITEGNPRQKSDDYTEGWRSINHEEESAEAQLSHVTETPLPSDAPERQPEDSFESTPEEIFAPGHQPDTLIEEVSGENSKIDAIESLHPITPTREISDENRENINTLMKEAGFRSNVPSAIREIRPNGVEIPSDTIDFEKFKKDGSTPTTIDKPYSPQFHGLDSSSPVRKEQNASKSPIRHKEVLKSSPPKSNQNTWETVSDYESPGPEIPEEDGRSIPEGQSSDWVTEGQSRHPSSPPVKKMDEHRKQIPAGPLGPDHASSNEGTNLSVTDVPEDAAENLSKKGNKKKHKKTSSSKALDLWQQFEPIERMTSPESVQSSKESPAPGMGFDGTDERRSTANVQYPQLSIGSSFASQVTDVGRQPEPDLNFDESTILGGDDFQHEPDVEMDNVSLGNAELAIPQKEIVSKQLEAEKPDAEEPFSNQESTPHESINQKPKDFNAISATEDDPSSDDSFPPLESLSQPRTIKREKLASPFSKNLTNTGADRKTTKAIPIDDESDHSNQSTPKISQRQISEARSSKSRVSDRSSAQPNLTTPRASQSNPAQPTQRSEVIDLCSEPEAAMESDDPPPSTFKSYHLSSDDDDLEEIKKEASGWSTKKNNAVGGVETRRQTSVGFKSSSQTSMDRNRRKTVAR